MKCHDAICICLIFLSVGERRPALSFGLSPASKSEDMNEMVFSVTRRSAAGLLLGTALAPSFPAYAQDHEALTVRPGGQFKPVPIAVTDFGGEPANAAQLTSIVTDNFRRSVFLVPLDKGTFPEQIANPNQPPRADAWRTINAQFVVTGRVGRSAEGRLQSEFRLWGRLDRRPGRRPTICHRSE